MARLFAVLALLACAHDADARLGHHSGQDPVGNDNHPTRLSASARATRPVPEHVAAAFAAKGTPVVSAFPSHSPEPLLSAYLSCYA